MRVDSLSSFQEPKHNSPEEDLFGKLNESLSDEGGKSDDSF